eukprot:GHVP01021381.1.p1 GENE.GHVP01021381.1~~GHVP01021381.1.p1  ORF type:complete len:629 (+),score=109.42 GHVP01021381.1:263-1888(+)
MEVLHRETKTINQVSIKDMTMYITKTLHKETEKTNTVFVKDPSIKQDAPNCQKTDERTITKSIYWSEPSKVTVTATMTPTITKTDFQELSTRDSMIRKQYCAPVDKKCCRNAKKETSIQNRMKIAKLKEEAVYHRTMNQLNTFLQNQKVFIKEEVSKTIQESLRAHAIEVDQSVQNIVSKQKNLALKKEIESARSNFALIVERIGGFTKDIETYINKTMKEEIKILHEKGVKIEESVRSSLTEKILVALRQFDKNTFLSIQSQINEELNKINNNLLAILHNDKSKIQALLLSEMERIQSSILKQTTEYLNVNIKESIHSRLRDTVYGDIKDLLYKELTVVVENNIKETLFKELKASIILDVRKNVIKELRNELYDDIKKSIYEQTKKDVLVEVEKVMYTDVKNMLYREIRETVYKEIRQSILFEFKQSIYKELREEIQRDILLHLSKNIKEEVHREVSKEFVYIQKDIIRLENMIVKLATNAGYSFYGVNREVKKDKCCIPKERAKPIKLVKKTEENMKKLHDKKQKSCKVPPKEAPNDDE